jgi:hypothetical protein
MSLELRFEVGLSHSRYSLGLLFTMLSLSPSCGCYCRLLHSFGAVGIRRRRRHKRSVFSSNNRAIRCLCDSDRLASFLGSRKLHGQCDSFERLPLHLYLHNNTPFSPVDGTWVAFLGL